MRKTLIILVTVLTFVFSNNFSVNAYHRPTDSPVVIGKLDLGGDLTAIAPEIMSNLIYVANYSLNKIHVLENMDELVTSFDHTITSPKNTQNMGLLTGINGPLALAIDTTVANKIYVANSNVSNPYSIVTNSAMSNFNVQNILIPGSSAGFEGSLLIIPGILFDMNMNMLYLSDYSKNRVILESSSAPGMNTQFATTLTTRPAGIAFDSDSNTIFVANSGGKTIATITQGGMVQTTISPLDFSPTGIIVSRSSNVTRGMAKNE